MTVKAGAKQDRLEPIDETHFRISVKAPAREGKANEAVLRLLAGHFRQPRLRFSILRGLGTRNKIIEFTPPAPAKP